MIKRSLYERLERLEARVMPACRVPDFQILHEHSRDGKSAGLSVIGPDGRHVWVEPPEGSKKGDPVEDSQNPHIS